MSLPDILVAARDGGYKGVRPDQWVALVVLVEEESGGDAGKVAEHFDQALRYPAWSIGDHARYSPRIALRTPAVAVEMARLGIEAAGDVAGDVIESATEPILEIARLPIRVLQWLTDPGTQLRIAKVILGGGLILAGGFLVARPVLTAAASTAGKVIAASPQGRAGKIASTARKASS